jgi:pimeloyl-ACP methyl ester carboxylesterase
VQKLGRGDPLVLLHGLATTQQIWSLVVVGLARDRQVITLDLPGFGASAPADPGFDLEAVAECDLRPWLAQTSAPMGVLWGQHDRTIPRRLAGEILSARPDAVLEEIARSGHVPMVERPEEFVNALRSRPCARRTARPG